MGRPRKPLDEGRQAALVMERLKQERPGWRRERLQALKLGLEGELDLEAIGQAIGRSRSVIQIWFDRYRQGGVEALLTRQRGKGPASQLTPEHEEFLRAGLAAGRWRTAAPIREALAERGLHVKRKTIYHYLGKCRARLRGSAPVPPEKGPRRRSGVQGDAGAKAHRAGH